MLESNPTEEDEKGPHVLAIRFQNNPLFLD